MQSIKFMLMAFTLLLVIACQKDENTLVTANSQQLEGDWTIAYMSDIYIDTTVNFDSNGTPFATTGTVKRIELENNVYQYLNTTRSVKSSGGPTTETTTYNGSFDHVMTFNSHGSYHLNGAVEFNDYSYNFSNDDTTYTRKQTAINSIDLSHGSNWLLESDFLHIYSNQLFGSYRWSLIDNNNLELILENVEVRNIERDQILTSINTRGNYKTLRLQRN